MYLSIWVDKNKQEDYKGSLVVPAITMNAIQASYEEGLKKIKDRVKESAATKEELEKFLEENKEALLSFADNEQTAKEIELLKKVFVYNQKDIKTKTDLEKMIDRRIRDFKELQSHKLQRQKLREQRKQNGRPRKA